MSTVASWDMAQTFGNWILAHPSSVTSIFPKFWKHLFLMGKVLHLQPHGVISAFSDQH